MTDGIGFDASNYGYAVVEKTTWSLFPTPLPRRSTPFCEVSTLSMTGNAMIIDYPQPPARPVSAQHRAGGGAVYA